MKADAGAGAGAGAGTGLCFEGLLLARIFRNMSSSSDPSLSSPSTRSSEYESLLSLSLSESESESVPMLCLDLILPLPPPLLPLPLEGAKKLASVERGPFFALTATLWNGDCFLLLLLLFMPLKSSYLYSLILAPAAP